MPDPYLILSLYTFTSLQLRGYSTPSFIFLSQDEDDDLYSDDLRPGAPKGQKAASSAIVCFSTESRKPPKRADGIMGRVGRAGLVDCVNEEKQLAVFKCLTVWKKYRCFGINN